MSHDPRFEAAVPAYLLGALSDDELVAFEAHLERCKDCRAELADLKVAADALPIAVEPRTPAAALEGRLMATVRAEAELLRATGPDADRTAAPARPRRALPAWLGRPAFALAATVLVLAVGALGGVVLFGGADDTRTLQAAAAPQGARVSMLVRDDTHGTLRATGLPDAGDGRVYQVWTRTGHGAPRPTDALFRPSTNGSATVDVPRSLEGVDNVLVTSEPDGGSRTPTRDPIIAVKTS